jgi:hypothetical protein
MASLGDFTPEIRTDVVADPDTFTFCGEEFELPPTSGAGSFLQFAFKMKLAQEQGERGESAEKRARTDEGRAAARVEKSQSDMNAMSAVYSLLTSVLGESQMDRLARAIDRSGVPIDQVFGLVNQIEAAVSARPTKRSSDSSAGPSTTGESSTGVGSGLTDPVAPSWEDLSPRQQQIRDSQRHLVDPGSLVASRT